MSRAGFITIGVAFGVALAALIFHNGKSGKPATVIPGPASLQNAPATTLGVSRSTAGEAKGTLPLFDESAVRAAAAMRASGGGVDYGAMETKQKLLSAGFTPDRADWLIQRTQELKAASYLIAKEYAGRPLAEQRPIIQYLVDPDLPLREQVGDADYATYREASLRPIGAPVTGVIPDSPAARVGLKQGDEIIKYGDKHVYSYFDLVDMASKNKSGAPTFLEVRRDGQTFQVLLSAGELGIQEESFPSALSRLTNFPIQERLKSVRRKLEEEQPSAQAVQK